MKIFDDNFNILEHLAKINREYDSDINLAFYTNSSPNDIYTISNSNASDFQTDSVYQEFSTIDKEIDINSISDSFERDARRYSRGFENGVIY